MQLCVVPEAETLVFREKLARVLKRRHPAHCPLALALADAVDREAKAIGRSVVAMLGQRFDTKPLGARRVTQLESRYSREATAGRSERSRALAALPPAKARAAHEAWAREAS